MKRRNRFWKVVWSKERKVGDQHRETKRNRDDGEEGMKHDLSKGRNKACEAEIALDFPMRAKALQLSCALLGCLEEIHDFRSVAMEDPTKPWHLADHLLHILASESESAKW